MRGGGAEGGQVRGGDLGRGASSGGKNGESGGGGWGELKVFWPRAVTTSRATIVWREPVMGGGFLCGVRGDRKVARKWKLLVGMMTAVIL